MTAERRVEVPTEDSSTGRWSFITVTYNSAAVLREYWSHLPAGAVEWIVVDNASSDESAAVAAALGARVIRLPSNRGFSYANNVGLDAATGDLVAFCNPDVRVDLDGLPLLAGLIERYDALVAPQLLNADGSLQSSARGLPFLVDKFAHRGVSLPGADLGRYLPQVNDLSPVCWVMGAAICGSRAELLGLGGWNSAFFIYYEDHELGLRAWAAGVPVLVTASVRWRHGWARETTAFRLRPWLHEIASAARFFVRYPELLVPAPRLAARRHRNYAAALAADDFLGSGRQLRPRAVRGPRGSRRRRRQLAGAVGR